MIRRTKLTFVSLAHVDFFNMINECCESVTRTPSRIKAVFNSEEFAVLTSGSMSLLFLSLHHLVHISVIEVVAALRRLMLAYFEGGVALICAIVVFIHGPIGVVSLEAQAHLLTDINVIHEALEAVPVILVHS
jgi:archaellum biogenesis protein FlaJ (TadC family)